MVIDMFDRLSKCLHLGISICILLICMPACSFLAYAYIRLEPGDTEQAVLARELIEVAARVDYKLSGRTNGNESQGKKRGKEEFFDLYFVPKRSEISRIVIHVRLDKENRNVTIMFQEFGHKDFSDVGLTEYRRYVHALTENFGQDRVAPDKVTKRGQVLLEL